MSGRGGKRQLCRPDQAFDCSNRNLKPWLQAMESSSGGKGESEGSSKSPQRRFIRPVERQRMRPWLVEHLDRNDIAGLCWQSKREKIFRIAWKHAANQCFNMEKDTSLFEKWAIHTGRHYDSDHKRWKANFRCALNSLPDVAELKDQGVRKGNNAFKVYKFLDEKDPKTVKEIKPGLRERKKKAELAADTGDGEDSSQMDEDPDKLYIAESSPAVPSGSDPGKGGDHVDHNYAEYETQDPVTGKTWRGSVAGKLGGSIPLLEELQDPAPDIDLLLQDNKGKVARVLVRDLQPGEETGEEASGSASGSAGFTSLEQILAAASQTFEERPREGGSLPNVSLAQLNRLGNESAIKLDIRKSEVEGDQLTNTPSTTYMYLCQWCEKCFPSKLQLFKHFLQLHQDMLVTGSQARDGASPEADKGKSEKTSQQLQQEIAVLEEEVFRNYQTPGSETVIEDGQVLDLSLNNDLCNQDMYVDSDLALDLTVRSRTPKRERQEEALDLSTNGSKAKRVKKKRSGSRGSRSVGADRKPNGSAEQTPVTADPADDGSDSNEGSHGNGKAAEVRRQHSIEDILHAEILMSLKSSVKSESASGETTPTAELELSENEQESRKKATKRRTKTSSKTVPTSAAMETNLDRVIEGVARNSTDIDNGPGSGFPDLDKAPEIDKAIAGTSLNDEAEKPVAMAAVSEVTSENEEELEDGDEEEDDLVMPDLKEMIKASMASFPYKCVICGRTYTRDIYLTAHLRSHSGLILYRCGICGKNFSYNGTLRRHVKTHKKPFLYECNVCKEGFQHSFALKLHMKQHKFVDTGSQDLFKPIVSEKVFECKLCGKRLRQGIELYVHIQWHRSRTCKICSVEFDNLSAHMKGHLEEKPYICNICDKSFSVSSALTSHVKSHLRDKVTSSILARLKKPVWKKQKPSANPANPANSAKPEKTADPAVGMAEAETRETRQNVMETETKGNHSLLAAALTSPPLNIDSQQPTTSSSCTATLPPTVTMATGLGKKGAFTQVKLDRSHSPAILQALNSGNRGNGTSVSVITARPLLPDCQVSLERLSPAKISAKHVGLSSSKSASNPNSMPGMPVVPTGRKRSPIKKSKSAAVKTSEKSKSTGEVDCHNGNKLVAGVNSSSGDAAVNPYTSKQGNSKGPALARTDNKGRRDKTAISSKPPSIDRKTKTVISPTVTFRDILENSIKIPIMSAAAAAASPSLAGSVTMGTASMETDTAVQNESSQDSDLVSTNGRSGEESIWVCTACGQNCPSFNALYDHAKQHVHNHLTCPFCPRTLKSKATLLLHRKQVHPEKVLMSAGPHYKCPFNCPGFFKHEMVLKSHIQTEHMGNTWPCTMCNQVFKYEQRLRFHSVVEHGIHQQGMECPHCRDPCLEREVNPKPCSAWQLHARTQAASGEGSKSGQKGKTGEKVDRFLCPFLCCTTSYSEEDLRAHLQLEHPNKMSECKICKRLFMLESDLKRHMIEHSVDHQPYVCQGCGEYMDSEAALKQHVEGCKESKSTFRCDVCDIVFTKKEVFLRHTRYHETKTFCEICSTWFPSKKELQLHRTTHIQPTAFQKQFKCICCDVVCDSQLELTNHVQKHMQWRAFICKVCWTCFRDEDQFYNHIDQQHPGYLECMAGQGTGGDTLGTLDEHVTKAIKDTTSRSSPTGTVGTGAPTAGSKDKGSEHVCPICGIAFMSSYLLKQHKVFTHMCPRNRNVTYSQHVVENLKRPKSYSCRKCGKSFDLQSTLLWHLRFHVSDKPYACDECDCKFQYKYGLAKHKNTHRKGADSTSKGGNKQTVSPPESVVTAETAGDGPVSSYSSSDLTCCFCAVQCANVTVLRSHIVTSHRSKIEICSDCNYVALDSQSMITHNASHHRGPTAGGAPVTSLAAVSNKEFYRFHTNTVMAKLRIDCDRTNEGDTVQDIGEDKETVQSVLIGEPKLSYSQDNLEVGGRGKKGRGKRNQKAVKKDKLGRKAFQLTKKKIFGCGICNKSFFKPLKLSKHIWDHQNNRTDTVKVETGIAGKPESSREEAGVKVVEGVFMCTVCRVRFYNASELFRHSKIHLSMLSLEGNSVESSGFQQAEGFSAAGNQMLDSSHSTGLNGGETHVSSSVKSEPPSLQTVEELEKEELEKVPSRNFDTPPKLSPEGSPRQPSESCIDQSPSRTNIVSYSCEVCKEVLLFKSRQELCAHALNHN